MIVMPTLLISYFFLVQILLEGQDGIEVVLDSCNTNSTFVISGHNVDFKGEGDLHDDSYDDFVVVKDIISLGSKEDGHYHCAHTVYIFPSDALKSSYETNKPIYYALAVVVILAFAGVVFMVYDYFVTSRQTVTEQRANKSSAIVRELFPGQVAKQLFEGKHESGVGNKGDGQSFGDDSDVVTRSKIAEFFPEASVIFCDIAG